ncbi:MAG: nitroreductase family protein [Kordiimonadaceae bacterium]|nr:nitroreductase family protein [Kordiimonadaceae bacterium]MBO6568846.1 nitroreductase family protein [Kordiimonadaceae bacterium]MBO6965179.1 nitroreductase family protein [Kordiimonadaceae bacterium]
MVLCTAAIGKGSEAVSKAKFVEHTTFIHREPKEMISRSADFLDLMKRRRTVREFSDRPVPREVIENAILTAGRAPSGANKQPWHFAAISAPEMKAKFREAAEVEEREFYGGRASEEWLEDLLPFGTDENKPFLEIAPWLIAVFRQSYGVDEESGDRSKNYYVHESAGLAAGFLIAALHNAGLATLTHTPSPMGFLNELCGRPKNEHATMLVVAGFPADKVTVPDIDKKSLEEISTWL